MPYVCQFRLSSCWYLVLWTWYFYLPFLESAYRRVRAWQTFSKLTQQTCRCLILSPLFSSFVQLLPVPFILHHSSLIHMCFLTTALIKRMKKKCSAETKREVLWAGCRVCVSQKKAAVKKETLKWLCSLEDCSHCGNVSYLMFTGKTKKKNSLITSAIYKIFVEGECEVRPCGWRVKGAQRRGHPSLSVAASLTPGHIFFFFTGSDVREVCLSWLRHILHAGSCCWCHIPAG